MGWMQVEAADKLGYSASLVSGIETMDKDAHGRIRGTLRHDIRHAQRLRYHA